MTIRSVILGAGMTIPVGGYIIGYPFFKLLKKSKKMSERWYGFVFSIVYKLGHQRIQDMKELLFNELKTTKSSSPIKMLEIGPGFGGNFKFYPPNTKLTTIEINNHLEKNFEKIKKQFPNITLEQSIIGNAQNMSQVEDNSIDIVVGTLIFCCMDDPIATVKEINRVLKKGGKFYFLENVHCKKDSFKFKLQKAFKPFWKGFTVICQANAFDDMTDIEKYGFEVIKLTSKEFEELPIPFAHFQFGVASKM